MKEDRFRGVIPAMMTPLTDEGKLNLGATEKLVGFLLDKGVNGLFILGTFGEGVLFSLEERRRFVEKVIGCVKGKVPVIVLASHMEMEKTKKMIRICQDSGADAVALLPPFYYPLSDKAIEEYFRKIFKEFENFPFFIYNIPQCTINEISFALLRNLTEEFSNLVGLKHSKPSLLDFQSFLPLRDKISLFIGEDSLDYSALLLGAEGIISGPSGIFPEPYLRMYQAFVNKDYEEARRQQMLINDFLRKVQEELSLQKGEMFYFYKKALRIRGIEAGGVKEPLPTLESSREGAIAHLVEEFLKLL